MLLDSVSDVIITDHCICLTAFNCTLYYLIGSLLISPFFPISMCFLICICTVNKLNNNDPVLMLLVEELSDKAELDFLQTVLTRSAFKGVLKDVFHPCSSVFSRVHVCSSAPQRKSQQNPLRADSAQSQGRIWHYPSPWDVKTLPLASCITHTSTYTHCLHLSLEVGLLPPQVRLDKSWNLQKQKCGQW